MDLRSAFADDVAFIGYLGEVNLRVNMLISFFSTLSSHLETEEKGEVERRVTDFSIIGVANARD